MYKYFLFLLLNLAALNSQECTPDRQFDGKKVILSNKEWKERLPLDRYEVLREDKTEPPFDNLYNKNDEKGIYVCAACHLPLFSSAAKYDSGTGWPSFWKPICPQNVTLHEDTRLFFLKRTEVKCSRCDSHLGHLFDDGPPPSGKRYCMNSLALIFEKR